VVQKSGANLLTVKSAYKELFPTTFPPKLGDLTDVNAETPNDNDVLSWDAGTSRWIAEAGGGGVSTFLGLSDTPANYAGSAGYFLRVNATPDAVEFRSPAQVLSDLSGQAGAAFDWNDQDLSKVSSLVGKEIATPANPAAGYNKLYFKNDDKLYALDSDGNEVEITGGGGAVSESDIQFLDNFDDEDIHWAWLKDNITANKTITELATGKLEIEIDNGTSGDWWSTVNTAPKLITGINPPCEIICKLTSITTNNETRAGLFIAGNAIENGSRYFAAITMVTIGGVTDLQAIEAGNGYDHMGDNTLPIWFKIKVTSSVGQGHLITFFYSTDGTNWTQMEDGGNVKELTNLEPGDGGMCAGLYAQNWASNLLVTAEFDFFKIIPTFGPG